MKIAFTAQNDQKEGLLDPRFGRAKFFMIYDSETKAWQAYPNTQNLQAIQGAGIQAATHICKLGAQVLISGNVGPKAYKVLTAQAIAMYECHNMTIADALAAYQQGKLIELSEANVEGHWV